MRVEPERRNVLQCFTLKFVNLLMTEVQTRGIVAMPTLSQQNRLQSAKNEKDKSKSCGAEGRKEGMKEGGEHSCYLV